MNRGIKARFSVLVMISLICVCSSAVAKKALNFSASQLEEIMEIAKSIEALNPRLDDTKYMEYAVGVYKASKKYQIEPIVLVSIAQQETSFRENLPEGKAGERGICQIRKMWLKNPMFVKEFKAQTIADLEKPVKNFLFAAWILKDLKKSVAKGSLPYWSFYNAVRFENRFKYFLAVNRNIATLLRHDLAEKRAIEHQQSVAETKPVLLPPRKPVPMAEPARVITAQPLLVSVPAPRKSQKVDSAAFSSDVQELITEGGTWIPDALRRMQKQKQDNDKMRNQRQASKFFISKELAANIEGQLAEPSID